MKRIHILLVIFLALLTSCGKETGNIITQSFPVNSSYEGICLSHATQAEMTDAVSEITITADECVVGQIKVHVKNGMLHVSLPSHIKNLKTPIQILIPNHFDIKNIQLSDASRLKGVINTDVIHLELSDAACFDGLLNGNEVTAELTEASCIKGKITAQTLSANLSDACRLNCELQCDIASIDMINASTMNVTGYCTELVLNASEVSALRTTSEDGHYNFNSSRVTGQLSGSSTAYLHSNGIIRLKLLNFSELHYSGHADVTGSTLSNGSQLFHDTPSK